MELITRDQLTYTSPDKEVLEAGFDKLMDTVLVHINELLCGLKAVYLLKYTNHVEEGIDMDKVEESYEYFKSVGFTTAEDFNDKLKTFTWAYHRSIQVIVETAHHPKFILSDNHSELIDSAKYPRRMLERILDLYCKEAEANADGIMANCAQIDSHMRPVEYKENIYLVDSLYDIGITQAYHSQILVKLFNSAVSQYEVFVEQTAEYHAECMQQCMQAACAKLSSASFININHTAPDQQHVEALEAFNKKANEINCPIITRNYGFLITWCISKSHFNKKKMIRQIKIDMNCEQSAIVMQKRYVMSTVRRNSQYSKVSCFVDRLAEAYQLNEAAIIKKDEDDKKRIDKAYEGLEREDDKKVMDDIISSISEL